MDLTRRRLVGLLGGGALAGTAGQGLVASPADARPAPDELRLVGSGRLDRLSPFDASKPLETTALELLYEPGLAFEPLTGRPIDWLFSDWTVNPDGPSVEATLRDGLTWSDGEALIAEDVAFTATYVRDRDLSFEFGETRIPSPGPLEAVNASDERTVTYEFAGQTGIWQAALAMPILPKHVWRDVPNPREYRPTQDGEGPVASGPFTVEGFDRNSKLVLAAREDAADHPFVADAPAVERVGLQEAGDEGPAPVVRGEAHAYLNDIPPDAAREISGAADVHVAASRSPLFEFVGFNLRRVPFDDRGFRQFLARVLDDDVAADRPLAVPGDLLVSDAYPHLRPAPPGEIDRFPFFGRSGESVDVDAARTYLREHADATHEYTFEAGDGARAPDGKVLHVDGRPFGEAHTDNDGSAGQGPVAFVHPPERSEFVSPIIDKFVSDLRRVGVPIDRRAMEGSELKRTVYGDEAFDAFVLGGGSSPLGLQLRWRAHSDSADLEGTEESLRPNAMGYTGADEVLDRAMSTMASGERLSLLEEAAERIYEDCPIVVARYRRYLQPVSTEWTRHIESPRGVVNRFSLIGPRTVTREPDPDVRISPSNPAVGETVTFDASGTTPGESELRRFAWDLGNDGTVDGEGAVFETTFDTAGEVPVRLTVVDELGAAATEITTVTVQPPPPPSPVFGEDSDLLLPVGVGGLLAAGAAAWWRRDGPHATTPTEGRSSRTPGAGTSGGPGDDGGTGGTTSDERAAAREAYHATVERADAAMADAESLLDQGDLDAAEDALLEALEMYEQARERARNAGIDDGEGVAGIDTVEAKRAVIDRRRLANDVEDLGTTVADAEDHVDAGQLDAAEAAFADARDALVHLADVAREDGFDGVAARADDLVERCREGLDAVEHRRELAARPGPPDAVPTTQRADLSYDDIERQDLVGKGGNADVYRATARIDGRERELAVKEPRFSGTLHSETVERFGREAETWAKLDDHDNVVTVIDYGEQPLPWIAMEYMDGGDLGERIDRVDAREATWYGVCMARAIKHAHRRGVSHLDLKPANVMFRETDGDDWDVPKIADWGLAKMLLEHSKSVDGLTPQYAAPEQLGDDGGTVDHQTDVYQLGAVLYELYTGEPVFAGSTIEVVRKVADEPVTPPTAVDPSLPAQIDDVLLEALAKDPTDRYEDLIYLRDDLEALLDQL